MKKILLSMLMLATVLMSGMASATTVATYTTICKANATSMNTAVTAAIAGGKQPYGNAFTHSGNLCQMMVTTSDSNGRLFNTFRVGATAGWVITGVNHARATLPASQTASTLVIPITGLRVGQTITAYSLVGQIESAGNTVTVDAQLHKVTAAAADVTDSNLGSMTQLSVTADTAMSTSNTSKTLAASEVVGADESFYLLVTATTAASTDIDFQGTLLVSD